MCGVHAQVMTAAELSLGIRTGETATAVREALWTDRSLVKTFGLRGTIHLFPADELPFWGAALSSLPYSRSLPPELTLSPAQVDDIVAAIGAALQDTFLTADELTGEVVKRAGAWAGALVMPAFDGMWPLWRMAMSDAANRGALCFGPNRGRKVTYTNPSRWVPASSHASEDPFGDLALRYLASYGPATPQQFAQWLAIPKRPAVELFERLSDQLEEVSLEGKQAWLVRATPDHSLVPGLRLLPLFDAYTVGCHPRDLLFPGTAAERALARGQAGNVAVILIDGTVQGVWHQKKTGKKLAVTAEPFLKLSSKMRRLLEAEAERVGLLAEAAVSLTIGEVTARAHL